MRLAVISVTANGSKLSERIVSALGDEHCTDTYCFKRYSAENAESFTDMQQLVNEIFYVYDGLVFVCAAGIAIRKIAPLLSSKFSDPAVLCVDECGKFVIPLVSGHLGGANALAQVLAEKIGSMPVITTATDIGGKFSPDCFAAANHLHIVSMNAAKQLATAVLNGEKIGLYSDFPCKNVPDFFLENDDAEYGLCISDDADNKPFKHTLNLLPKRFSIGFGCKKDIEFEKFEEFILKMLTKNNIPLIKIRFAATIDLKKNEKSILRFCRKQHLPLRFYTVQQLMNVSGNFSVSGFVKKVTGADNVCERSAVSEGGRLIVPKHSESGMTFAAAVNDIEIDFERRLI